MASPASSQLTSRFSFRARVFSPDIVVKDKRGGCRVRVVCASLCVEASEKSVTHESGIFGVKSVC